MYRIHILDAATRELARLDKPVGRRIVERLNWLVANFDTVTPEPLTGELLGLYWGHIAGDRGHSSATPTPNGGQEPSRLVIRTSGVIDVE